MLLTQKHSNHLKSELYLELLPHWAEMFQNPAYISGYQLTKLQHTQSYNTHKATGLQPHWAQMFQNPAYIFGH